MQTFKFSHMTAEYEGGKYTLTADAGYVLQNTKTGEVTTKTVTKDYTQWQTIEGEAPKTAKKTRTKKQ